MQKFILLTSSFLLLVLFSGCQSNSISNKSILSSTRSASFSSSPTFHAIIVADTNDSKIGTSVKVDLKNIEALVANIEANTGANVKKQTIYGSNFDYQTVSSVINNLSVSNQDVVFFYYAGHGVNRINSGDKSRWPSMAINGQYLGISEVVSTLKSKNPQFFIAMADACNDIVEQSPDRGAKGLTFSNQNPESYLQLFLQQRGHIIASSTHPDQKASGNSALGGLFTHKFLNVLNENLSSSSPSWKRIASEAEKTIEHSDGTQQDAMFAINLGNNSDNDDSGPSDPITTTTIDETSLSLKLLPSSRFQVGDEMKIKVRNKGTQNGYLFVWDIDASGQISQVLPNEITQTHRLNAGQTIKIPEHSYSGFSLTMKPPTGKGIVIALLVDSNSKNKVLSGNLESISAGQAQAALQTLKSRLQQLLSQSKASITHTKYEIF